MRLPFGTVKYQPHAASLGQGCLRVLPDANFFPCPIAWFAMTMESPDGSRGTEHRKRLLEGLAHSVAGKGYAETTIADIVREAGVSRRTFYEHFDSKSEALIALYENASRHSLRVLEDSLDPAVDWAAQAQRVLEAYLASLAQNPTLLRTLFIEILALGPQGLLARRRANDGIADFLLSVINARRRPAPLSRPMALAVIGGIHELVLHCIERDQLVELQRLAAPAADLLRAVAADSAGDERDPRILP